MRCVTTSQNGDAGPRPRIDRVSKRYGAHLAVDDLSLAVRRGSFDSGPSGCARPPCLAHRGISEPDSGDVRIGARSMRGVLLAAGRSTWCSGFGAVP